MKNCFNLEQKKKLLSLRFANFKIIFYRIFLPNLFILSAFMRSKSQFIVYNELSLIEAEGGNWNRGLFDSCDVGMGEFSFIFHQTF